jgi:hypothetical protein
LLNAFPSSNHTELIIGGRMVRYHPLTEVPDRRVQRLGNRNLTLVAFARGEIPTLDQMFA